MGDIRIHLASGKSFVCPETGLAQQQKHHGAAIVNLEFLDGRPLPAPVEAATIVKTSAPKPTEPKLEPSKKPSQKYIEELIAINGVTPESAAVIAKDYPTIDSLKDFVLSNSKDKFTYSPRVNNALIKHFN